MKYLLMLHKEQFTAYASSLTQWVAAPLPIFLHQALQISRYSRPKGKDTRPRVLLCLNIRAEFVGCGKLLCTKLPASAITLITSYNAAHREGEAQNTLRQWLV